MEFEHIPLLQRQRDLQRLPRDLRRFETYLETVLEADRGRVRYPPLVMANPMAREHVTERLDEYLALGAETLAVAALDAMDPELIPDPGRFRTGLAVIDDVAGGWTNRYLAEFASIVGTTRLTGGDGRPIPSWLEERWIPIPLPVRLPGSAEGIRIAVVSAVLRASLTLQHGAARTLRDIIRRERRVHRVAGAGLEFIDTDELAYSRDVIQSHLDATDPPTCVTCLFGDVAARELGYQPLGLGPDAGLELIRADVDPETDEAVAIGGPVA
jgi:hypothetical protein